MVTAAGTIRAQRRPAYLLKGPSGWATRREAERVEWASLISRIAERADRDAFKELFDHFAPRIKGFLIRRGVDRETAEEIAQETLVIVWRKAALYNPSGGDAAAWIYTIARNLRTDPARRVIRSGKAVAASALESSTEPYWTAGDIEPPRDGERVREALRRLPVNQKIAVRMAYLEERPHSEIATELQIPLGTVKSRIRLAMARLRTLLDDRP
jgi:RNA polymerase sigma factor (sigma-70 family)